jgi:hypothetical protein
MDQTHRLYCLWHYQASFNDIFYLHTKLTGVPFIHSMNRKATNIIIIKVDIM